MRRAKRWRYYCEYCHKGSGSPAVIKKHERGCTMNPDRDCGYCRWGDLDQRPMSELLTVLPIPLWAEDPHGQHIENLVEIQAAFKRLRELANGCPACLMAAIRQKGIPVPAIDGFDFKRESDIFWNNINEAERLGIPVFFRWRI